MIARLKLPLDLQWCPKCGAPCLDDPGVTEFTHGFNRVEYAVKLRCANGHESVVYLTIDAIRTAYSRDTRTHRVDGQFSAEEIECLARTRDREDPEPDL